MDWAMTALLCYCSYSVGWFVKEWFAYNESNATIRKHLRDINELRISYNAVSDENMKLFVRAHMAEMLVRRLKEKES